MIGIVAEGKADVAVIRNILKGRLGVERHETYVIRPELTTDATDGAYRAPRPEEMSNWGLVLEECRQKARIADFLQDQIDEVRFVVVHIDTAEAHVGGYDIPRPDRAAADYSENLRALVVARIAGLLGPELASQVRFAIAVEEIDAWVLTLHDSQDRRDTGARLNPKERLKHVMKLKRDPGPELYDGWTRDLRKPRQLEAACARNRSLRLFVDSL
jgi:hypothetical protein